MSAASHDAAFEALGTYALGALDEGETVKVEAHVSRCTVCQEELGSLQAVVDQLSAAVPVEAPPPALKARVMAQVEADAELMRAASGVRADKPSRARHHWYERFAPGPLGLVAACALLVLVGFFAGVNRHSDPTPERTVAATLDRDRAPGAEAALVRRGSEVALVVKKLPKPPAGRVYQVWLQRRDHRAPSPTDALFTVNSHGSGNVAVPGDLRGVQRVLVTVEPPGGSSVPSQLVPLIAAPVS